MKYILYPVILMVLSGCTAPGERSSGSYKAGFKIVDAVDSSRVYKPGTGLSDYLHFRPLKIDIWYPAVPSPDDSLLKFRDILGLLERRAVYYTGSTEWKGITGKVAQSFCEGVGCSDTTQLLGYRTRSWKDAAPVNAKFPLVIYMCAYNGMSFENFPLFEELAARGFVVASISSIGRYPGDMTMKKEDLDEQVNDAVASLHSIRQESNIDFSRIGLAGYSWGSLAGAIFSEKIPELTCIVSLDGSEFHHYGLSAAEDSDFNIIRQSPELAGLHIRVPWLRLESTRQDDLVKVDSIFDFTQKVTGEKQVFKIDSTSHEDFSCIPELVKESGNCEAGDSYKIISDLTISFLDDNL
jgi:dienelactone hydrolase